MDLNPDQLIASFRYDQVVNAFPAELDDKCEQLLQQTRDKTNSAEELLKGLYILMDEVYAFVNAYTPCGKSCNSCCKYNVAISKLEIRHIKASAKVSSRQPLKRRKKEYFGKNCPFLTGDGCSIYAHRPYACRRHVTLAPSNYWCETSRVNQLEMPILSFKNLDDIYDAICIQANETMLFDIRDAFRNKA